MKAQRLLDLVTMRLSAGSHADGDDEMCVMEAAAYLAGEDWTDRPVSVSNVIRELLVAFNDAMSDDDREALRPLISVLPGSRGNRKLEAARSWMVTDWHCRSWPAAWLRAAGCIDEAAPLESAAAIVDAGTLDAVLGPLRDAHAVATDRRLAAMDQFVEESLEASIAAAGANGKAPALLAARRVIRTGDGWAAISAAQKAVPAAARWNRDRGDRWSSTWDAAGYRMAVAAGTAQIAVVRALAATSAWNAGWDQAGAPAEATWDQACRDARSAGREAAMALASSAAWSATEQVNGPLAWPAAADASAAALQPAVAKLQRSAIGLVAAMIDLDLESVNRGQPDAWR